ncbi:MAG: NUDIX hydrolase [Actinomycetota bacterium]
MADQQPSVPADQVALRPAATVMLVRDQDQGAGIEVLMVRRNLNSDFVGGAYVFPGGAGDPADSASDVERRSQGRTDVEASEILGIERGGLAYWVAVLRECFEEAGVLLATDPVGTMLRLDEVDTASRFAEHRRKLNARECSFVDIALAEDLHLAVQDVAYFAHWITPEGAPRRYDTRFFVARAPEAQVPAHDAGEVIADLWISPAEALAAHQREEIELIFPTIKNLQAISRFTTVDALLEAAAAAESIPAIMPRITVTGEGVRILLPGDEGYDQVATPTHATPSGDFNATIRRISHQANPGDGATPQA